MQTQTTRKYEQLEFKFAQEMDRQRDEDRCIRADLAANFCLYGMIALTGLGALVSTYCQFKGIPVNPFPLP